MTFVRDSLPDTATYFADQGLPLTGPRSSNWRTTRCEFHGGSDCMRVNTTTGGWVCMSCGEKGGDVLAYHMAAHGLEFIDAAKALGCWQEDGQPFSPQNPKPLPSSAALSALAVEAPLIAVSGGHIYHGIERSTAS